MKTAISLPDDVFAQAEDLARKLDLSRSELFRRALEDYLARHAPDRVTRALDEACVGLEMRPDDFVSEASRRLLGREDW